MLSSIAVRSGVFGTLLKNHTPFRVLAVIPAGSRSKSEVAKQIEQWDKAQQIFYGPERDTKNFPHPVQPVESGKVRLGFIPEEWFQFLYPKTGVTAVAFRSLSPRHWLLTTLLSKEIWVVDHGFAEVIGFYGAIFVLTKTVGGRLAKWMDDKNDKVIEERYAKPVEKAKAMCQEAVKANEQAIWQEEGQKYLWEAKKEHVALQLEAAYRRRLDQVYKEVKNRLDYHMEVQSVKRRFEQQHMVNWIVKSVKQSITPQQEQENIRSCIATLNSLAKTA
ncbi:ATP synthase subunit b, mitochondrial-like [Pomacea canaliculata]|uniref:ATP synthase subunit b, mitochondrial-like n=1 Tax=Pomacea canaliculata TaxID=400727 RepID=UPI000D73DD46|nr:ATP synthase subunit b, mitochondrial-like [Pomacea canaliculata]